MSVEALDLLPTLAEQRGRGTRLTQGENGCHGPRNGDGERALGMTLPVGLGVG